MVVASVGKSLVVHLAQSSVSESGDLYDEACCLPAKAGQHIQAMRNISSQRVIVALAVVVAGCVSVASGALDASACPAVPIVDGVDQTPTNPAEQGKCTNALDYDHQSSNWCTASGFYSWPDGPTTAATQCLKFGRMTVYTGPIMGQSTQHFGACATTLIGSDKHAMIAVSSKYLNHKQGGWELDKGACGKCACVRLHGGDEAYVGKSNLNYDNIKKYQGLTFAAIVGDRCGECEDDHVDVLIDRPFSYAYYDPSLLDYDTKLPINAKAPLVNRLAGLRGFSNPQLLRGGPDSPAAVGVYTADWQWAPCTHTHADCAQMFASVGYDGSQTSGLRSWTPAMTRGIDSKTLEYISSPSEDSCGPIVNADGTLIGAANIEQPAQSSPSTTASPAPESSTPQPTPQASPATSTPSGSPATSPQPGSSPVITRQASPVPQPSSSPAAAPQASPAPTPAASPAPQQTPSATPSPNAFSWANTDVPTSSLTATPTSTSTDLKGSAMIMSPSSSAAAESEGFKWLGLSGWQVGLVIAAIVVGGMAVLVMVVVGTALAARRNRVGESHGVVAAVSVPGGKGGSKDLPVSGGAAIMPMHGVLVHTGANLSRGTSGVTYRHSGPGGGHSAV